MYLLLDEAETLIQNFDDLSERLKAVENELKEGLEVNSMQQEFNLKECKGLPCV